MCGTKSRGLLERAISCDEALRDLQNLIPGGLLDRGMLLALHNGYLCCHFVAVECE